MSDDSLLPGRILRRAGPPKPVDGFRGVQIDDDRLATVLPGATPLMIYYEGTLHAEGPAWHEASGLLYWSDVPNRRLLCLHPDGHVETAIDGTYFMNGNAVDLQGRLVHCEHGRRCISRSDTPSPAQPTPIVTHYQGKRLNSPNDVAVAPDGSIWFADPTFGILMPNQGSVVDPELDHRSVYRFDPATEELRRMADFAQPNGVAFTQDGRTLYVSDTALSLGEIPNAGHGTTHEIIAFDVGEDGTLSNRRFFCHTDHGYPDGFVVDSRGWVWTSAEDGVHVWSADRRKIGYIRTEQVVSNLCFGGPNGRRLFMAATKQLLAIDLVE
ncbi:MAG: SMP-30/gluconolactonase/LRE family protein [Alphaproteobacteria bacterium]|nr:MAG: SMP-30/gluconolactonase/LRE family protein [Alphaproteobacteria bacterium]